MWDRAVVILRGLAFALLVAVVLPGVARAATDTVTNTNDSGAGSLRAVIAASNAGDTIAFDPSLDGHAITLTNGAVPITHALTVDGPGAGTLTIDGNDNGAVFSVDANAASDAVTISGLAITGGAFTGAGASGGGGISAVAARALTLSGLIVSGNQATISGPDSGGGGGVWVNGANVTITGSVISSNRLTLTGANGSENGGGGLYSNGGNVILIDSDVSGNSVSQTQTSNSAADGGGGIYSAGGNVSLTTSVVTENSDTVDSSQGGTDGGGGIYTTGPTVTLDASLVDANSFTLGASAHGFNGGGGIYASGSNVETTFSAVDDNSVTITDSSSQGYDGGGGLFSGGGTIAVTTTSISANTATISTGGGDAGGGGVLNDGGINTSYLNSTLSSNVVGLTGAATPSGGGAIFTTGGDSASDLTIAGNQINRPGGGILSLGTFRFRNTIIADNSASPSSNCAAAGNGIFVSAGFNLENANTCGLNAAGDLPNTEPDLGPLQDNGGIGLTQALTADSPAIDAGSCTDIAGNSVTTDQRGVTRPQPAGGRCDIGAYELIQTGTGGSGPPPPPSPPVAAPAAVPAAPTATSSTAAAFSGSVNPEGQVTRVLFQYGIDDRYRPGGGTGVVYDQSTAAQTLLADSNVHAVSATVSGLIPNALYHARLVASNATGTTFGPDQTFTTPPGPAPPAPVAGQSVNAAPVSGRVFVLVGTTLVPLTELSRLTSGTIVDARAGSLQLTAAAGGHNRETGVFGGAVFRLTQTDAGLTTLALVESAFSGAPSYTTCRPPPATDAQAAGLSSRTLQLLHASAHGRFRTSGRYSAATVRGTKWTIADRCDGTLTHDLSDSVAVTDFVRRRTVILHAGQSYLARAPRRP